MVITRYSRWDGTQAVRLSAADVFDRLAELLSGTDDVRQALEWMMRQGVEGREEKEKVKGLDDLVRDLREEMRKRYRDCNLRSALDEPKAELEDLLGREQQALEQCSPEASGRGEKRDFLSRLPSRLSDAVERLSGHEFENRQAAQSFEGLQGELPDIRALESFQRRYGELFTGPRALTYREALDLMREMERMRGLEEGLLAGNMQRIDPRDLKELMGQGAWQDFENLRQVESLLDENGYTVEKEGRLKLSPKGVRRIGRLALRDIYQSLLRDRAGAHAADHRGLSEVRPEASSRSYRYGDPLHLDLVGTLKRSLLRGAGVPVDVRAEDFVVFDTDHSSAASTVLLLDMSWSMSWEGRFAAAKKVALALETLIRTRFPRDYLGIVGFFTRAVELKIQELPEASWNMGDPFTNLQDGLRLGGELLRRHPNQNRQMIVVTDGQPTAYFSRGRLYCEWPLSFGGISMRAAQETLKEAERVTRQGVRINIFMLDDSPSLQTFIDRIVRINRGRAFYTRPDSLGEYLLVDYVARRRRKL